MLPYVYSGEVEDSNTNNESRQDPTGFLADFYQSYEKSQGDLHTLQMEALRERDRERERDMYRERDKYREDQPRARSRSRGRSRSRERRRRSRSRDRQRTRSRSSSRDRRYRDRGRSRSPRRRSRSRSRGRDRERDRDFASSSVPVSKLALLNLPNDVDRNMIAMILAGSGYLPQDIRVVHRGHNSSRGPSRSFGFIDFADVGTAIKWMEANKGGLLLPDGRRIGVQYARGDPECGGRRTDRDWMCANCTVQNFFKREMCFKCDTPRAQSDEMERQGMHMIGVVPCDTLLMRNLPPEVTTTSVFEALVRNIQLTCIVQLVIAESKKFAYVQMKSADEATQLFNSSYKLPIRVLGKDVIITYCRHPLSQVLREQASIIGGGPSQYNQPVASAGQVSGAEVAQAAMMRLAQDKAMVASSQQMAAAPPGHYHIPTPSQPFVQNVPMPHGVPPVQQHPGFHAPPVDPMLQHKRGIIGLISTPNGVMQKYVPPNPTTFILEPSTGYFLDPITNFYYDAKTAYYYNNDTQQWTYWDGNYSTYFPIQQDAKQATDPSMVVQHNATSSSGPSDTKSDNEKKTASDVAKEMAKWAKKQEKQKLQIQMKPLVKTLESKSAFDSAGQGGPSESGDSVTMKMLEKAKNPFGNVDDDSDEETRATASTSQRKNSDHSPPLPVEGQSQPPVPERPLISMEEQREMMERALIDESKKMCLLCKRAFPSVDVLRKHVDKSDLHKKNLETKREEWNRQFSATMSMEAMEAPAPARDVRSGSKQKSVYRDRAKERRAQYGLDGGYGREEPKTEEAPNEESLRLNAEEAARRPLDDKNIGSKLLKNMGWKEGQGVGRFGQGIVNPIEADRRMEKVGLGASGSRVAHSGEISHKDRVRATFFNRYYADQQQ